MSDFNEKYMTIIMGSIVLINVIGLVIYIYHNSKYVYKKCENLDYIYSDIGKVSNFNVSAPENKDFVLRDFYIKTAYNCCAIGNFKNTYVSTCALKQVIRQGARCLDFEIYSVNNEPVIAV